MEMSIDKFTRELPFDKKEDIKSLVIRLKGPRVAAEEMLGRGEGAQFDTTKMRLLCTGKICLENHNMARTSKTMVLNFKIKAIREGGAEEDDDDDDDVF